MTFYHPTLSGQKPVVPAFVFACSWAGGVFAGCCVGLVCGFVAARMDVVLVANAMAVA